MRRFSGAVAPIAPGWIYARDTRLVLRDPTFCVAARSVDVQHDGGSTRTRGDAAEHRIHSRIAHPHRVVPTNDAVERGQGRVRETVWKHLPDKDIDDIINVGVSRSPRPSSWRWIRSPDSILWADS